MATVLVVDDDLDLANTIASVLTYAGFETLVAASGRDGMSLARERRPDMILLDIMMPDMDGSEMMIRLRSDDLLRDIPVICLTGLVSAEDANEGLGEITIGGEKYATLAKPFDNQELIQIIKHRLGEE